MHIRRERQWLAVLRQLLTEDPTDLIALVFDGVTDDDPAMLL